MEKSSKKHRIRRGLVLGKFAPLHKGHQYLIECALEKCDQLYVLIYESRNTINIPLNVRADWIRHLYPEVIVIEGWGAPDEDNKTRRVQKLQDKYISNIVPKQITHFFSSEWYGEHVSKALGAENVVVDIDREKFPVSGTLIRSNPHKFKHMMDPYIYKDFVKKVVFLGAESTGKSTIARYTAQRFHTRWMREFGREYWIAHKDAVGKLSSEQLVELAEIHIQRENKLLTNATEWLFVDTNAITTEMFDQFYHGESHPKLQKLARLAQERYDVWFVCDTDIPYEDDGTRNGAEHRLKFQKQILHDLDERGVHYEILSGNLHQRFQTVTRYLNI